MKNINTFYLTIAVLGIGYFLLFMTQERAVFSFFGFAENKETEINYNHPVLVKSIHVNAGQAVEKGDLLLSIQRVKSKEQLAQEDFQIAELEADRSIKISKLDGDIKLLNNKHANEVKLLQSEKASLLAKQSYEAKVLQQLKTIEQGDLSSYNPIKLKLDEKEQQLRTLEEAYALRLKALENEKRNLLLPISYKINRLEAQKDFDEENRVLDIEVYAPTDGLVGSILCKEGEHIPSYKTLLTFYEPHSDIIKGFVHEDYIVKVVIGTKFDVKSLKDREKVYKGQVIGLGSRIVEIPSRLRKIQDVKTYGREVLVKIPKSNTFLQKEKVALSYVKE